jgi:hypothetical protein
MFIRIYVNQPELTMHVSPAAYNIVTPSLLIKSAADFHVILSRAYGEMVVVFYSTGLPL